MYSWDKDFNAYKWDSIQIPADEYLDESEDDSLEIPLDDVLEDELDLAEIFQRKGVAKVTPRLRRVGLTNVRSARSFLRAICMLTYLMSDFPKFLKV